MRDECEQDNHGIRWCRTHRTPIANCIGRLRQRVATLEGEVKRLEGYEAAYHETDRVRERADKLTSDVRHLGKNWVHALVDELEQVKRERDQWKKNHDTLKMLTDEDLSRLTRRLAEVERRNADWSRLVDKMRMERDMARNRLAEVTR